jgi:hypothetical protein
VVAVHPGDGVADDLIPVLDVEALKRVQVRVRARERDLRDDGREVLGEDLGDSVEAGEVRLEAAADDL